jgi:hypothetical protein
VISLLLALSVFCAHASELTLQACVADDHLETWTLEGGGLIQSVANDSDCVSGASGSPLVLASCNPDDSTQVWFFHAEDGTVRSEDNSTCWNVPGQSITPGTDVLAYPCGYPINGNLLFAYEAATRRIFANESGLC